MTKLVHPPTLEYGDTGPDVIKLQKRLKELGLFTGACKGNFKELTRTAVELAQTRYLGPERHPLEIDGIVDKVIVEQEKAWKDYQSGKDGVIKRLVGCVMKETKGKADPEEAIQLFESRR